MKTVLAIATLSLMSLSTANALNFVQVDDATGDSNSVRATYAGDGFVSLEEASVKGISSARFHAADINGDGKLTPTEFKNLG